MANHQRNLRQFVLRFRFVAGQFLFKQLLAFNIYLLEVLATILLPLPSRQSLNSTTMDIFFQMIKHLQLFTIKGFLNISIEFGKYAIKCIIQGLLEINS